MTADAAGTPVFPALDPEPPPRSIRARARRIAVGLVVLTVLVGGIRWAWVAQSSPSPSQSARILAYSHVSASLSITAVGSGVTTSYASIGPVDGGLLATAGRPGADQFERPCGHVEVRPAGRRRRSISRRLPMGRWPPIWRTAGAISPSRPVKAWGTVSLVSIDSAVAHRLGTGDGVAGDPTRPALYVAVAGGEALPLGDGFYVSPDRSIEHRGIGIATTVLTTAAAVIGHLHWLAGAPVTLAPAPNPTGHAGRSRRIGVPHPGPIGPGIGRWRSGDRAA